MKTVTRFIDDLLIENNVTLKMVYDCSVNDRETICGIKKIFKAENQRDFLLSLTALRILGKNNRDKVAGYFKKDYGIRYDLDEQFFEQNKTLVLTAFLHNPAFFAMAVNIHGLIRHELQKQEAPSIQAAVDTAHDLLNKVYDFIFTPQPALQFGYVAASGADVKWITVGKPVQVNLNGIKGGLHIFGKDLNGKRSVLFRFAFAEYFKPLPFYLDVKFITNIDNMTHELRLDEKYVDNPEEKELVITSQVKTGIDFSKGITVTEIRGINIG